MYKYTYTRIHIYVFFAGGGVGLVDFNVCGVCVVTMIPWYFRLGQAPHLCTVSLSCFALF